MARTRYMVLSQHKDETTGELIWLVRLRPVGAPVQGPTYLLRVRQQAAPYISQTTAEIDSRLVQAE